ncbi:MAG: hypothetical protein V3R29_09095 [Candidatus Acidoferrales bacterium]
MGNGANPLLLLSTTASGGKAEEPVEPNILSGRTGFAHHLFFLLSFCFLDRRALLLGGVTLGSPLVWILTLYNNRLFARA